MVLLRNLVSIYVSSIFFPIFHTISSTCDIYIGYKSRNIVYHFTYRRHVLTVKQKFNLKMVLKVSLLCSNCLSCSKPISSKLGSILSNDRILFSHWEELVGPIFFMISYWSAIRREKNMDNHENKYFKIPISRKVFKKGEFFREKNGR